MSEVDKRNRLDDEVFEYRETKDSTVHISWYGKRVMTLKGPQARKFLAKIADLDGKEAQIHVQHGRTTFNTVTALGQYRFTNLAALPNDLPVREALPTNIGGPGFVLQEWSADGRKILIVRRMRAG